MYSPITPRQISCTPETKQMMLVMLAQPDTVAPSSASTMAQITPIKLMSAIIPTIITQLLAGQQEIKLGSLTPTRDFNYVKDTAHGFMAIADCDAAIGQEINIATGVEHSIGDLANELIAQINPSVRIVCEAERLRPEKSEVNRLRGDATKLRTLTDWKPQYTFEQGLAETIEFLRGNLDQYKVGQYIL